VDDNCNGFTDEGVPHKSYFKDNDGDGYGGLSYTQDCALPKGYVEKGGDCNDYNKNIHPYAPEQCNNIDDDCNGLKDDNLSLHTIYKDNDGDSWAAKNAASQKKCDIPVGWTLPKDADGDKVYDWDCDDSDVTVYPGAPTKCNDGKDNNCDGQVDRLCFTPCSGDWKSSPYKMQHTYGAVLASLSDLDGDGMYEILVQDNFGFAIVNHKGKAYYEYSKQQYNYSRRWPVVADIDDYDSFGVATQTLEVLTGNGSVPNFYKLASNKAVTVYTGKDSVYDASSFMARDLDGDGQVEFFTSSWCQASAGTKVFRFDRNSGVISHVISVPDPDKVCQYYDGRTLTDLDGDGQVEFIYGNGYSQSYTPQYWGGKIYALKFTNIKTLAHTPYCAAGTCFPTTVSGYYNGSIPTLYRVGDSLRAYGVYFTTNTPNAANPSAVRYWQYDLQGKPLIGSPTAANNMWDKTTDINRDMVPENYGYLVSQVGLFDVNGDGYPDRIYSAGKELRVQLWHEHKMAFEENVTSRTQIASSNLYARALWDINGDGRLDVISGDNIGNLYCHTMGKGTWSKKDSLPPHFTLFNRTFQWDNLEPNDGADTNSDGLPDAVVRIPSALTAKGDFYSYLSSSTDKDYFLINSAWGGSICLTSPTGYAYKLKVYSFRDRWNNTTHAPTADGKADGLVWEKASAVGGTVCFYGSSVMPPRYGEHKFIAGIEPASSGNFSANWPYWLAAAK